MDRRDFLALGAATAGVLGASERLAASATMDTPQVAALNPQGIHVAGIKMIPVVGGKYKVWTKKVGDGALKVLLLHGGPGFSHEYFEVMESFLPQAGIEFYYYDQLGSNNSDQPNDTSLWTLPRFVTEAEEVRRGLGLENFVLFGHSWGGMLAIDYALQYQQHLRGVVISSMTAGIKAYLEHSEGLKLLLPPDKRARLAALEAKQDYDAPEYEKLMMDDLYPKVLCRTVPWPEPLTRTFRHANLAIYNLMQGKSEFLVTGNLKDWERWDRLHEIRIPALTIGATHDEMNPDDMRMMATLMPNAHCVICPNGSHMAMYDDQEAYFRGLLGFLKSLA